MAQPTSLFETYDAAGNKDDLSDVIYNISPTQTPFLSMAQRLKARNTYHEWQTDALAAAADNSVIEGDDATLDASAATARVGNYAQISDKTVVVSGTQEIVDKAGRKSELGYQVAKRSKELKRDMELILTGNFGSNAGVAGPPGTARHLGSVEAWLTSNVNRGAGGASGGFSGTTAAAATDGTQRAYTESLLKNVIQSCWANGGDP